MTDSAGGMGEIVWIILFVFLGALIATWIGVGGPAQVKDQVCATNPQLCGGSTSQIYSGVASESFEALGCAVTSTAKGQGDSCLTKYKNIDQFTFGGAKSPKATCYTQDQLICFYC